MPMTGAYRALFKRLIIPIWSAISEVAHEQMASLNMTHAVAQA
ncbi:MAG: hypothetical protein WKF84_00285 [Pyrinomonadaceae bacterium]